MISTDRCRITSGEKEKLKRKDKDDRKIMTHNSEKIDHEILAVFFCRFDCLRIKFDVLAMSKCVTVNAAYGV